MRRTERRLAAVAAALLVCALTGTASARTAKVTQELEYRDIRVSLDGEVLDLRDAAGNEVEPFMFGGTNYLPVRALAEALGLDVAWDGAHATVVLTTPDPVPDGYGSEWMEGSGTLDGSRVEIQGARLAQDDEGAPIIIITYTWTNGYDLRAYPYEAIRERAYQNGIQLEYADVADPAVYDPSTSFRQVRPGVTVEVQAAYVLEGLDPPVEFELSEYVSPLRVVYRDFQPLSLEGAFSALTPVSSRAPSHT